MAKWSKISRKKVILGTLVILVAGGAIAWFSLHHSSPSTSVVGPAPNNPANDKSTPAPATVVKNPNPVANANVPGGSTGSQDTSTAQLQAPSGTFVSNHQTTLDNSDSRNQESSSCTTSEGATCTIQFTKGSVTKTLGALVAGSSKDTQNGTVTWHSWTPADIGLTTGSWQVTAVATLNGKSLSTNDQIPLVVQ